MEGLEASVLTFSEVKSDNRDIRIDSPYFSREALAADALIASRNPEKINEIASDVRSFGAYALTNEFEYQDEGIPFLRGKNFAGDFIDFSDVLRISPEAHTLLHKSEVTPGMVLLSMSGSVGSVAVALDTWEYPINSNQDIAKIVPTSVCPFYLAAFLSSSFGQTQVNRLPVGSVQQHIFLWMIERISVPRFAIALEEKVASAAKAAYERNEAVGQLFAQAEKTLLEALGLTDWTPPEPVAYQQTLSTLQRTKRMDAEHFDPRHLYAEEVIAGRSYKRLEDLSEFVLSGPAWPSSSFTTPDDPNGAPFVRIRNCKPGKIEVETLDRLLPAGIAKFKTGKARTGDIAVGMDGIKWFYAGVLKGDAYINQRVGWVRLDADAPSPGYIQLVLNSPLGQAQLLRRMTIAQTVGHITLDDIRSIKIPIFDDAEMVDISNAVEDAAKANAQAAQLLETAKRAVEIAIEDGEDAAMAFLDEAEGAG